MALFTTDKLFAIIPDKRVKWDKKMRPGEVRIIGGKWRGRRLTVPDIKDLRPTPDRVRETLFNWLASQLAGAYCLDAFAGTGVLGFEALSRGAAFVEMVDYSPQVIAILQKELERFGVENALVYQAEVPKQLRSPAKPFDVVFLDPPYQANLLLPTCQYLEEKNYLADPAYIYLEAQHRIEDNELPENWHIIKSKKAGQVFYHLVERKIS